MASSPSYAAAFSFSTPVDRRRAFVPPNLPASFRLINISSRTNFRCNSNGDSGENVCKNVLDAFFLGKAIGEIIYERIESSVGEFLGFIATFQTDQLKHISQFQEDVPEKARRAKEEATLGARVLVSEVTSTVKQATEEAQALVSKAISKVEEATKEAQALVSEAASTVEATEEAISEAAFTAEQATEGLVTGATSTLEEAAHSADGLIQATEKAEELVSDAASKVTDVSKTITQEASSSLLNPTKDGSFLGIFKD